VKGKKLSGRAAVGMGISVGIPMGMGMGTVMNPHGPLGILWGVLIGWTFSGNALNMR